MFWAAASTAATVTHLEVHPKPARAGQPAWFRVTVEDGGAVLPSDRFTIFVLGDPLPARYEGRIARSESTADYFFTATAPGDFDWRRVRVRLDGQDYPAGLDDPYMICDAPFRVKSATAILPLCVSFHDADNDDVQLQFVEVFNDATGQLVASYPVWQWISAPFRSFLFDSLTATAFNCAAGDTAWTRLVLHCDDHDWPWIPEEYTFTQHLKVRVGRDLPAPPGWYYGDVHTHSRYTDNTYEYGGPLEMYAAATQAVGLSFAAVTDHSSDFDAAGNLWQEMADSCLAHSTPAVHLYPGEEITLDDNEVNNPVDSRIHFLSHAGFFLRGPEAPITGCRDTSEEFTRLSSALEQMEAAGGFGYAAHPFQPADPFAQMFGLAMMPWSGENYTLARASSAFAGLEWWNERNRYRRDVDYWYELNPFPWQDNPNWGPENLWITQGLAQWDSFLSQGLSQNLVTPALLPQKLFISAGSDCHGDFNYRTYNVDPIFYDVQATDNAFGALRTAVYVPGYGPGQLPPLEEIMTAYRLGRSTATDGFFLEIGVDVNGDGDLDDPGDLRQGDDGVIYTGLTLNANLLIRWESTEDWGAVDSMTVFRGTWGTGSNPTVAWWGTPGGYTGQQSLPLGSVAPVPTVNWIYFRATATGSPLPDGARRAFTNPVWVKVESAPTASVSLQPAQPLVMVPAAGGSFDYTIGVTNHTAAPVTATLWIEAVLPNGQVYPLLSAPLTLPPGISLQRLKTQTVPAGAPAGRTVS